MTLPDASLFRAYDVRGCATSLLTPDVAYAISAAFAARVRATTDHRILLGRDGRLSSPGLHTAVCDALVSAGLDVIDIGLVPTPVLYFAQHHFACGNAVMITGSHNPKCDNGFKLSLAGSPFFGDALRALRDEIVPDPAGYPGGSVTHESVTQAYIDAVVDSVTLARPLHIAVDSGNGAAGPVAGDLYRALGCSVTELYETVDGNFPNHHPDPAVASNLDDLAAAVTGESLALGIAFDGDGDRLGVLDNLGRRIAADRQLMVFAEDVLRTHPGAHVVFDVKCSKQLNDRICSLGGVAVYCKTGHANLKAAARRHQAPLAGELSGHMLFADRWYGFDDALYAGARMLEHIAHAEMPAADVFARLPASYATDELLLDCGDQRPHDVAHALLDTAAFADAELLTLDGLRVDFVDGWGLVRASNTTSNLVMRFEGDSPDALRRVRDRMLSALQSAAPTLTLPARIRNAEAQPH
ncbi:MAG: phosphomannomutase/phosphoglucomutase [Pseudomonadota bacterium]